MKLGDPCSKCALNYRLGDGLGELKEYPDTLSTINKYYTKWGTAQKMKFPLKDFSSKCEQIRRKLRIWPHLLKKSLM